MNRIECKGVSVKVLALTLLCAGAVGSAATGQQQFTVEYRGLASSDPGGDVPGYPDVAIWEACIAASPTHVMTVDSQGVIYVTYYDERDYGDYVNNIDQADGDQISKWDIRIAYSTTGGQTWVESREIEEEWDLGDTDDLPPVHVPA